MTKCWQAEITENSLRNLSIKGARALASFDGIPLLHLPSYSKYNGDDIMYFSWSSINKPETIYTRGPINNVKYVSPVGQDASEFQDTLKSPYIGK